MIVQQITIYKHYFAFPGTAATSQVLAQNSHGADKLRFVSGLTLPKSIVECVTPHCSPHSFSLRVAPLGLAGGRRSSSSSLLAAEHTRPWLWASTGALATSWALGQARRQLGAKEPPPKQLAPGCRGICRGKGSNGTGRVLLRKSRTSSHIQYKKKSPIPNIVRKVSPSVPWPHIRADNTG